MKKLQLILALVATLFVSQTLTAQCTPDPTPTSTGFYPGDFPDGEIGKAYDAVMNAVLPTDTTATVPLVGTLTVSFCAFEIDTIYLPDGLSYQCDQPGCTWQIDHTGAINRGCIRVTGTPASMNADDSIEVVIKIIPGYVDTMNNYFCNTDSLRNELGIFWGTVQALLSQTAKFKMKIDAATSIDQNLEKALGMSLFPNPTADRTRLQFELPETKNIDVTVLDATGREVQQIYSGKTAGALDFEIDTQDLPAGMYLVRVSVEGAGQVVRKLSVQ
ncbi:MAG: T9SS type A sorting domain-containing protein [Bacteroidia bacterium]